MNRKTVLVIFIIVSFVNIVGRLIEEPMRTVLDYSSKPLLIPLLFLFFWQSTDNQTVNQFKILPLGLFFAWLGDVFLMLANDDVVLFLIGLVCFLAMQVAYMFMYAKFSGAGIPLIKQKPYWAIPSVIVAVGFCVLLYSNLNDIVLKIAVLAYAMALMSMTISAVNRYGKTSAASFLWTVVGAFSFMFSDMMIAYNKFMKPFPMAGFWIMATYITGQFLIIRGMVLQVHYESKK